MITIRRRAYELFSPQNNFNKQDALPHLELTVMEEVGPPERLHVYEKKNFFKNLENLKNFDCFGTRASKIDVSDEKTFPTTTRTI